MRTHSISATLIALSMTLASGIAAKAAEIKVLSSVGMKAAIQELAPRFKRASEHKLNIKFGTIVPLKREIDAGETFATADALKRTLLNAKSIAYSKEGQSGTAMARLIERLGIAEEMKAKTVLETRSGQSAANVVEGKAELAFTLISEILPIAGAELAGPLPPDAQNYVVFAAGIAGDTKAMDAAKAFIEFLKSQNSAPVLKAKGMEPG